MADTSIEVVLGMLFLTLSNIDVKFADRELIWKSYITSEALLTTKRVELINKKEFAKAVLDEESKAFVVHVATLEALLVEITIHSSYKTQVTTLQYDKSSNEVPPKYADYADIFSFNLAMELPENTYINKHSIELEDGKQLSYGPIYSLGPLELETLKTYIKTHLKTGFIWPSKSPANAPILFDKKSSNSFWLCCW